MNLEQLATDTSTVWLFSARATKFRRNLRSAYFDKLCATEFRDTFYVTTPVLRERTHTIVHRHTLFDVIKGAGKPNPERAGGVLPLLPVFV